MTSDREADMAGPALALDMAQALRDAMDDPEFRREMRFFTGVLTIGVGSTVTAARFDDGKLVEVPTAGPTDTDRRIDIHGTEDHWDYMLQGYPVPFYQCLQTAAVKHGLELSTTYETFAYLPALNRLVQLLRARRTERS
jgi:hypothetical protein